MSYLTDLVYWLGLLLVHGILPLLWYTRSPTLWVATVIIAFWLFIVDCRWIRQYWANGRQQTEKSIERWKAHEDALTRTAAYLLAKVAMHTEFEVLSLPRVPHILAALILIGTVRAGWSYYSSKSLYIRAGLPYLTYMEVLERVNDHLHCWIAGMCPTYWLLGTMLMKSLARHAKGDTFFSRWWHYSRSMKFIFLLDLARGVPTSPLLLHPRFQQSTLYRFHSLDCGAGELVFKRGFAQWMISTDPFEHRAALEVYHAIVSLDDKRQDGTPAPPAPFVAPIRGADYVSSILSWWEFLYPLACLNSILTHQPEVVWFISLLAVLHICSWLLPPLLVSVADLRWSRQVALMSVVCELSKECFPKAETGKVDVLDSLWLRRDQLLGSNPELFSSIFPVGLPQLIAMYALEDVTLTRYEGHSHKFQMNWMFGKPRSKACFDY